MVRLMCNIRVYQVKEVIDPTMYLLSEHVSKVNETLKVIFC